MVHVSIHTDNDGPYQAAIIGTLSGIAVIVMITVPVVVSIVVIVKVRRAQQGTYVCACIFMYLQCNKYNNFTVNRDHSLKKKRKQGWSPTPAGILVGIYL